jgi:hypothetical protein
LALAAVLLAAAFGDSYGPTETLVFLALAAVLLAAMIAKAHNGLVLSEGDGNSQRYGNA